MLIDTHTHLYSTQFDQDRKNAIQNAINEGVQKFFLPNIDSNSIKGMLKVEEEWPSVCYAMMGLHPCSVKEDYEAELGIVKEWIERRDFVAIGEIGIDLYWDRTFEKEQIFAFEQQIEWAKSRELPIVIHSRDSLDLCIEIVASHKADNLTGIFHCFGGSFEQAQKIIDLDFLLGIGGVSTFKNGGLDKVLDKIALENLVLETDAPYLAPKPYRGKRNESAYLKIIAHRVSEIMNVPLSEVKRVTSENALGIFSVN